MAAPLWSPSEERVKATNMYSYMTFVNERHGLNLNDYDGLYRWSINNIPDFWASVWEFTGIKASAVRLLQVRRVLLLHGTLSRAGDFPSRYLEDQALQVDGLSPVN